MCLSSSSSPSDSVTAVSRGADAWGNYQLLLTCASCVVWQAWSSLSKVWHRSVRMQTPQAAFRQRRSGCPLRSCARQRHSVSVTSMVEGLPQTVWFHPFHLRPPISPVSRRPWRPDVVVCNVSQVNPFIYFVFRPNVAEEMLLKEMISPNNNCSCFITISLILINILPTIIFMFLFPIFIRVIPPQTWLSYNTYNCFIWGL